MPQGPSAELPSSMIDRMTLIIDTIGGGSARLGVDTLVRRTGLPRSTVRRILDQLVRLHWVTAHPDGYGVGRRLGGGVAEDRGHGDVRAAAAVHLNRLHATTGLTAHLARHVRTEVYFLDKVGGRESESLPSRVGGRAPIHATALGKASMAWMRAEDLDTLFAAGLPRYTHRTITDLALMHEELARVRSRRGLAHARGEHRDGVACVAAAIRAPGGLPVAAISLSGFDAEATERWAPYLLDAVHRIAGELFPSLRQVGAIPEADDAARTSWSPQMLDRMVARGTRDWL